MAIRNILVAFDGSEGAQAALTLGLRMADKYGAHLTGLLPHGRPPVYMQRLLATHQELREAVAETDTRMRQEAEALFRDRTEGRANVDWIALEAEGDAAIVENARYYDVTLIGQYDATRDETAFALHPDRIALQSGRPIIVVPRGHDRPLGDRAALAWDGQRAAARALSDAMQILETKERVFVLSVGQGAAPDARLRTHLARHGIEAEMLTLPARGSVGETLLAWCRENAPPLLVMGAYEHSKFRERLVGGVTESVLRHLPCPVLLAH